MNASRLLSPERWRRFAVGRGQLVFKPQDAEVAASEVPPYSSAVFDPAGSDRRLKVLLAYSHFDYGIRRRGISYETTAFRDPLCTLGCDVIEFRSDVSAQHGPERAARELLEVAFRNNPDLLFFVPFKDEIRPQTLGKVRDELGVPTLAWFSDDHWRFDGYTVRFLPYLSIAVTTAASAVEKYVQQGFGRVIKSQWAANHRIFRPLGLPLEHDVSFIGQPHSNRRELVERLRAVGLRVVTRGFGWPEGRASLREMVVISNQSRVCMNFSNASIGRENQIKGRDFEIPAMGRPMLTAASAELGEYYSDDEIAVYRDGDELVELARNLVADEDRRETLAKAGHTRFMADHTAERRLGDLLREIARAGWLRAG